MNWNMFKPKFAWFTADQIIDLNLNFICWTDINECASNPCDNHGVCRTSYVCECEEGYIGTQCETGELLCNVSDWWINILSLLRWISHNSIILIRQHNISVVHNIIQNIWGIPIEKPPLRVDKVGMLPLHTLAKPWGRLKWPYAITRLTAHFMCGLADVWSGTETRCH